MKSLRSIVVSVRASLALAVGLGAGLLVVSLPGAAQARVVDRIAAVVNTDVITLTEVDTSLLKRPDLAEELKDPDGREAALKKYREQAIDQLIAERLLEAEIRKRDLRATDLQIERTFELQIQANNSTRDKFIEELAKAGLTLTSYKEELGKRIQRQMLLERLFLPKIKVTDEDVKTYYNQNVNVIKSDALEFCVSHVLLQTPQGSTASQIDGQQKLAADLERRAKAGEEFEALAKQYSQDTTASKGGDLGCFRKGVMVPEFEKGVFSLKKGEISAVIRSPFGFHVAKVTDIKGTTVKAYDEVKNMIQMKLTQDAMEKQVQRWVDEEKKKAFIDRKL